MFIRDITNTLLNAASHFRVVTLTGPRQSGKTTLIRRTFGQKPYVSLEDQDQLSFATEDPRGFLAQFPEGVILDEIQNAPLLLSYIQGIVDQTEQKGMFILTGSMQLSLHAAVSQSLAGRTAILNLLPLSLHELTINNINSNLHDCLWHGLLPGIYKDKLNPTQAYAAYTQTYLERDLRQLIHIKDLTQFRRFIQLCAGRVGSEFNANSLANDVGVSSHTINSWLSLLETSYIIFRLTPYYENFGKRVIKSPKLYFMDVGLLCYLLGIEQISQLNRDPLYGAIFENLIVLELYKTRLNQGLEPNFYFYRDKAQHEIDIIYKHGNNLIPIEIKSAATFTPAFLKQINYYQQIVGSRCSRSYVIYTGDREFTINNVSVINYQHTANIITPVDAAPP